MKNSFILFFILLTALLAADEITINFSQTASLLEIAEQTKIPVKKITEYLQLTRLTNYNSTLQELNLDNQDVKKAVTSYKENEKSLYSGIVIVGMLIVFVSLILVGIIISSLQHVSEKKELPRLKIKKTKTVETELGTVTTQDDQLSSGSIIAAITALMLHRSELEEANRIQLTWARSSNNGWREVNAVENKFAR